MGLPVKIVQGFFVTAFVGGLVLALEAAGIPVRPWFGEVMGATVATPWAGLILIGLLGLAGTVAWEACSVHRRLLGLVNRWRGIPTPRQMLREKYAEACDLWERGRDMSNPDKAEIDEYMVEIAAWVADTEEWLAANFGPGEVKKLTNYTPYLNEPYFQYSESSDPAHNWHITTAGYLVRNLEALMNDPAWTRK